MYISANSKGRAFWVQPEELFSQIYQFQSNKHSLKTSHLSLTLVGLNDLS